MHSIDIIVVIGWIISGLIALLIIGSVVYISLFGGPQAFVPDILKNWGGIILGFYFGQFTSMIKDYMINTR